MIEYLASKLQQLLRAHVEGRHYWRSIEAHQAIDMKGDNLLQIRLGTGRATPAHLKVRLRAVTTNRAMMSESMLCCSLRLCSRESIWYHRAIVVVASNTAVLAVLGLVDDIEVLLVLCDDSEHLVHSLNRSVGDLSSCHETRTRRERQ